MYEEFTPLLIDVLPQHCDLIPGVLDAVASGNELGLSRDEIRRLEGPLLLQRLTQGRQALMAAGAHYVIDTVADLPKLILKIEQQLAAGERP